MKAALLTLLAALLLSIAACSGEEPTPTPTAPPRTLSTITLSPTVGPAPTAVPTTPPLARTNPAPSKAHASTPTPTPRPTAAATARTAPPAPTQPPTPATLPPTTPVTPAATTGCAAQPLALSQPEAIRAIIAHGPALAECLSPAQTIELALHTAYSHSITHTEDSTACLTASLVPLVRHQILAPKLPMTAADNLPFAMTVAVIFTGADCLHDRQWSEIGLAPTERNLLHCIRSEGADPAEFITALLQDDQQTLNAITKLAASCPNPVNSPDRRPPAPMSAAIDTAVNHLGLTDADTNDLELVTWEHTVWNDGAMGCPAPDRMYTQAEVPGYIAIFTHPRGTVRVHVNERGSISFAAVNCPQPNPTPET